MLSYLNEFINKTGEGEEMKKLNLAQPELLSSLNGRVDHVEVMSAKWETKKKTDLRTPLFLMKL